MLLRAVTAMTLYHIMPLPLLEKESERHASATILLCRMPFTDIYTEDEVARLLYTEI